VLVPLVVAALTEPPNPEWLVVVVVVGLDRRTTVAIRLARAAALLAERWANETARREGLLDLVVRPILADGTTAIEVAVIAETLLRAHLHARVLHAFP
jgi:hypothetical protein